ncbi:oligosaccharide flippase family protein [Akkermansiaceae bacterium]|nr:oligosaccharide flippase family protein [Akkermansiaceae bacterium]
MKRLRKRIVLATKGFLNFSPDLRKLFLSFFSANFAVMFTQGITGIIVARLVDPDDMGIFVSTTIILTFIPLFLIGINNGLNRELPYVLGQERFDDAKEMRDTSISFALIVSVLLFSIILIISIRFLMFGNYKLACAFLSTSILSAVYPLTTMQEVTYRTNNEFLQLSRIKFYSVFTAVISILLVFYFNYYGMLIRSALITLAYLWFLYYLSSHKFKFGINLIVFRRLFKTGFPIAIVAYMYVIFTGLDKVFIVKYFGIEAVGNFVPAIQIATALSVLPTSIYQIIYPRMANRYGKTNSIISLKKLAFKPQILLAFGLIPLFLIIVLCVGPFVEFVLPKYTAGIPAAKWMVLVIYIRCLGGPQDVLTVLGDLIPYAICTVICAFVFWLIVFVLKDSALGLQVVPIGLAVSTLLFNFTISIYVLILMKRENIYGR